MVGREVVVIDGDDRRSTLAKRAEIVLARRNVRPWSGGGGGEDVAGARLSLPEGGVGAPGQDRAAHRGARPDRAPRRLRRDAPALAACRHPRELRPRRSQGVPRRSDVPPREGGHRARLIASESTYLVAEQR